MADSTFLLREYRPDSDRAAVINVMEKALTETDARFVNPPPAGDPTVVFDPRKTDESVFLVAEDRFSDEIIGTGAFRPMPPEEVPHIGDRTSKIAELKRMHILPDYQREGLGQRILDTLRLRASGLGYETFMLQTTAFQQAAISFYEGEGFELINAETVQIDNRAVELLTYSGNV